MNNFENIMENEAFAPSIFHNIFKYMISQRGQKALLWSKGLSSSYHIYFAAQLVEGQVMDYCYWCLVAVQ